MMRGCFIQKVFLLNKDFDFPNLKIFLQIFVMKTLQKKLVDVDLEETDKAFLSRWVR